MTSTSFSVPSSAVDSNVSSEAVSDELVGGRSRRRIDLASPVVPIVGLVLAGLGLVLLGFTWAKVAPLLDVALQLPYVVSGGFGGLALIVLGSLIVNVGIRRQDAVERSRDNDRLVEAVRALDSRLDEILADET